MADDNQISPDHCCDRSVSRIYQMSFLFWNGLGLVIGTGLVFNSGFTTWRDYFWKTLGVIMIIVSVYRLIGG